MASGCHRARRGAGRDRGVPRRGRAGPGALVLSGEAGIGKTILWEAGVEEARAALRPRSDVPRRRGRGVALLRRALRAARPRPRGGRRRRSLPPRRRALEVALLLAEPGDEAPDPHAIGLAVLDVLRALAERGPVLVALDDAPVARPGLGRRAADRASAPARRARRPAGDRRGRRRRSRAPLELERSFPDERLERISLGPLSLAALHRLLEGAARARADPAGARPRAGGDGRQSVLRARARARARPHEHEADAGPGAAGARQPAASCSAAASPGCRRRPSTSCSRPRRSPGRRSSWSRPRTATDERVLEALEAAVREGVIELDDSRVRFAHPLLASICYEQAPVWKRRAVHRALAARSRTSRSGPATWRSPRRAPTPSVASELDTAAEQAAARGAPAAAAELCELAAELTPGRSRAWRGSGACERRTSTASRATASGQPRCSSSSSPEVPSGVERADVLLALASDVHGRPPDDDRALRRGPRRGGRATTRARRGSWPSSVDPPAAGRRPRGARRRPRGAREGRARRRPRAPRGGDRTGGPGRDVGGRDHTGPARAGRRDRGAPRARPRVLRRAHACALGAPADASGRDRPSSCDSRGAGEEGARHEATRARAI